VSPARINFGWLVRLRFATVAGQALTIAVVRWGMNVEIPMGPLLALVGLALVSNLVCIVVAHLRPAEEWWLLAVMAFDVVTFSGLLYFTGGPENPFSFLYLVPIAIAAITLRSAWTWLLVLLSLVSSLVLFARHQPLPMIGGGHAAHMALHLRCMWVAFGVAAAFIVYFLMRVRRSLAAREEELGESRSLAARQERLASLATLAAGAAHELATPLSTIAVIAKDLEREVAAVGVPAAADDVRLMRDEVERCRRILSRMRVDAGDPAGERFANVSVREILNDCLDDPLAGGDRAVDVTVDDAAAGAVTALPRHAFGQALRGLVDNARQASPPGAPVTLRVAAQGTSGDGARRLVFEIADRGTGIPPELVTRVGEPFFTTKPAGQGMGLGIFLARSIVERLGGGLSIRSAPGAGTTATVWLPVAGRP